MASAARGESSNPYGGLGTGGKFRKPTARRSQKTPYDRPPTSVRNSGPGGGEDKGGGWLSKLVDPAQRLITYSAHKLFASVFRKRLVSGETPLQSPEQQQLPERGKGLVAFFDANFFSSDSFKVLRFLGKLFSVIEDL